MHILFYTQYFPPETGAAQNRLSDLAKRMLYLGHQVTVLTALPSYPKGEIFPEYRGKFVVSEQSEGTRILRTWAYVTKKKSFVPRILNYLSFALWSLIVAAAKLEKADIVVVESPPLFLGFSGYALSKLMHASLVLNISDLWPESAVALGMLRNRHLIQWATSGEEWLYRHSSLVTGQTAGIVESIRGRCASTPVHLLTNGVASEFIELVDHARKSRTPLREKFGFEQKFIVAYTGVHGLAQGLETLLQSAALLKSHENIQLCFFGDGPEKPHLQSMAAEQRLRNVQFFPSLSASQMPELLASIDLSVIPLKRCDLFKGALPSKLFEGLGAGVPVVASVEGEAQAIVEESNGGMVVEPENSVQLAESILRLAHDPDLCTSLGKNGRAFISKQYSRRIIAERFDQLLSEMRTGSGSEAQTAQLHGDSLEKRTTLISTAHPKADD